MLLTFSKGIDKMNTVIGRISVWFILISVVISAANATSRFVFSSASNSALEAQWMAFDITFLYCAPWVLMLNEHIRIDILNSRFKPKTRYWIDILGHSLVLIPFCILMLTVTVPWAISAFEVREQSGNAGGLPLWPIKCLVPPAFFLLLLQGVSELIKRVAVMQGKIPEPYKNIDDSPEQQIFVDTPIKE